MLSEEIRERMRELLGLGVAILVFVPSLFIRLVDRITIYIIRRRGGLD